MKSNPPTSAFQSFFEEFKQAPRFRLLGQHFDDISRGIKQVPNQAVLANEAFLTQDSELSRYHQLYQKNMGTFWHHYCASIPFIIEEYCRIGVTISKLARQSKIGEHFTFYEMTSADGTDARTLAEYAQGNIHTLTDSLNPSNQNTFQRLCNHPYSQFYLGPFIDITPEFILSRADLSQFHQGFDVIRENATFQFYGRNRQEQIAYVSRLLKDNGLMFFMEKLKQPDLHEYNKREMIKDRDFKLNFFNDDEIIWKKEKMLDDIESCQVSFDQLVNAIGHHFEHIYLLWNSTNFYELVASNSHATIELFISLLPSPYIPSLFRFEGDLLTPRKIK